METAAAALIDYNYIHIILVSIPVLCGLFLILWAGSQLKKRQFLKCCLNSTIGGCLLCLSAIFTLIISNLYTYNRLTLERNLARVYIQKLDVQRYLLTVDFTDKNERKIFEIKGDEWQIDARILKWKYPIIWLGLDSHYQLDRISGRYSDINSEINKERSVFALSKQNNADIWPFLREYQNYLPLIDAVYGSASYLPMKDDAEFEVIVTQTGLIARPSNETAKSSTLNWH